MEKEDSILCSACLLGVRCRYDGESKPDDKVLALMEKESLIPVCPEQLGVFPLQGSQQNKKAIGL